MNELEILQLVCIWLLSYIGLVSIFSPKSSNKRPTYDPPPPQKIKQNSHGMNHRDYRLKRFEETILPQLEAYNVTNPTYGKYTIQIPEYGFIDIFPKANKLLIRKSNKWLNGAEKWIIRNVFKETD